MSTADQLSGNSRQGFGVQNAACIGFEAWLSRNMHWRCGHIYDETPVGIAVYVRNDPVNRVDPDGMQDEFFNFFVDVWEPASRGGVILGSWAYPNGFLGLGWWDMGAGAMVATQTVPGFAGILAQAQAAQGFLDWLNSWNKGVNTSISKGQRDDILKSAGKGLSGRVVGNCAKFINDMIGKLGGLISNSIHSASDLIDVAIKNADYDVYGAVNASGIGLNNSGSAFAYTEGNLIHLGENFFDASLEHSYKSEGGDPTSTLLHEFFHLFAIGNGARIKDETLDQKVGGSFDEAMRTNCGPK
jgi:hypothetical protein